MNRQFDLEGTVLHEWRHYFSDEEKTEMKDESIQVRNQIDLLEEEKKETNEELNRNLKAKRKEEKALRTNLNRGFKDKTERVKIEMNFAAGLVEFYDLDGVLVDKRKMTRKEVNEGRFVNN